PIAPAQDKRTLDHGAFPGSVVANEVSLFADQLCAVVGKFPRPNDRRELAAVPVLLPDQVAFAFFIRHSHGINRARFLRYQRAVVGVRSFRLVRAGHSHAERTVPFSADVINIVTAAILRYFRGPKIGYRPVGPLGKDRADNFPVYKVARMQNWELRSPLGRGGRRPVILANSNNGWIGIIPRQDRVGVGPARFYRGERERRGQAHRGDNNTKTRRNGSAGLP